MSTYEFMPCAWAFRNTASWVLSDQRFNMVMFECSWMNPYLKRVIFWKPVPCSFWSYWSLLKHVCHCLSPLLCWWVDAFWTVSLQNLLGWTLPNLLFLHWCVRVAVTQMFWQNASARAFWFILFDERIFLHPYRPVDPFIFFASGQHFHLGCGWRFHHDWSTYPPNVINGFHSRPDFSGNRWAFPSQPLRKEINFIEGELKAADVALERGVFFFFSDSVCFWYHAFHCGRLKERKIIPE